MGIRNRKLLIESGMVCLVLVFAVFFRLWFANLVPQPFWWDQEEYQNYAAEMMGRPFYLAANSYRSYPYPLILAMIYTVAGFGNHQAVFALQAVLDGLTGVLIFVILQSTLKNRTVSWLGMLGYAVNPFTAGYVGMVLSEVLSAFTITATILTGVLLIKKPGIVRGLLLGFFAGLSAETRNAAFLWAAIPILLTLVWVNWKKQIKIFAAVGAGMLLTVIYPLAANWQDFREINITTVDSITAREFFNGAILTVLPPFTRWYPPEVQEMYREYYSEFYPQRTGVERRQIARKYMDKGWAIVAADPVEYIRWRFFKMWYVWQKENIFFIVEPGYEDHRILTYRANQVLLALAFIGLIAGWKLSKERTWRYVILSITGTVIYGTLAFAVSHAEYRLTIPFYPLIIIAAATGGVRVISVLRRFIPGKK